MSLYYQLTQLLYHLFYMIHHLYKQNMHLMEYIQFIYLLCIYNLQFNIINELNKMHLNMMYIIYIKYQLNLKMVQIIYNHHHNQLHIHQLYQFQHNQLFQHIQFHQQCIQMKFAYITNQMSKINSNMNNSYNKHQQPINMVHLYLQYKLNELMHSHKLIFQHIFH